MARETDLLLCDCTGTMRVDTDAIARGCGLSCDRVATFLCRDEAGIAAAALRSGRDVVIACGQEAGAFRDLAEDVGGAGRLTTVDIRDRAGWSEERASGPKMAALIAESRLPRPMLPAMDVTSEGVTLVVGPADKALPAAERLAGALTVTCMIDHAEEVEVPPGVEVVAGRVRAARGALGRFEIEIDRFAELLPAGRGPRRFAAPRDGAKTRCDVIVDLTGNQPMFPAPLKRDGYVRADPRDPLAVERALFDAAQMVGTFEKPVHIRFEAGLCAHSRAGQTGCTRCLDLCPTSAIRPDGESVTIDPHICAGCGACAAVCPTGAASTDDPPVQHLFARMRVMAEAYRKAGGKTPRLLVHDAHGTEMIRLAARHGRGLPADVIPLEVSSLAAFGHAEQLAALALGYTGVDLLAGPHAEFDVILAQFDLTRTIAAGVGMTGERLRLLEPAEPDALSALLYGTSPTPHSVEPILPIGGRRDVTRLAAMALAGGTAPETAITLPKGAPYGRIEIDTQKCTLCLACVSLCPPGALGDNPDRPEVNFREAACVQCGLCANVCPETAIRLVPQLDLTARALAPRELHGEEPFCCIECGAPFGTKSTIERITEKLSAHAMFQGSDNARLIQMCDDCRVRAQYHAQAAPFRMGERPRMRTTQDYLDEREDE